jgi:hypothetical protein
MRPVIRGSSGSVDSTLTYADTGRSMTNLKLFLYRIVAAYSRVFCSRSVQYYDHRHVCQHRERMTNWRSITSMCSSVKNTSRSAVAACMQLLSSKLL